MADQIKIDFIEETILINPDIESIYVDLVTEQVTIEDVSETINVIINETVDNTLITIEDVSETIDAQQVVEIIEVSESVETIQVGISEQNINQTISYTFDTTATSGIAGETINKNKIVVSTGTEIFHADTTNLAHLNQVLGISLNAGSITNTINILTMGILENLGWTWTSDVPLFLSTNGALSETPSTTGFSLQVAQTLSATKIWFDLKMSIKLR